MKERFIVKRVFENGHKEYFWGGTAIWSSRCFGAARMDSYDVARDIISKQSTEMRCIYQIEKIFVL